MPDPPPFNSLPWVPCINVLGNYEAAFSIVSLNEDEHSDERNDHAVAATAAIRHDVARIEQHPPLEPQTFAAVRNLERARSANATELLLESRESCWRRTIGNSH